MQRNESDTRAELIDPRLRAVGWGEVDQSYARTEEPCPGRILPGGERQSKRFSDYVLVYQNKILAVIEAKKAALSFREGRAQALDYANRLDCQIAYMTNGKQIYQIDRKSGEEGEVDNFMSPQALWEHVMQERCQTEFERKWYERFSQHSFASQPGKRLRYYQRIAVDRVLEAVMRQQPRILLTMATGTGKTFVAAQIAYKLFQSKWSLSSIQNKDGTVREPRILFLADRNILADQAYSGFIGIFPEEAMIRLNPKKIKQRKSMPKNGHLFFTIYQTVSGKNMNKKGEEAPNFQEYAPNFFDFIIIDECHRGGANAESSWRKVLDYFQPAYQLGMTATPKHTENIQTYHYFGEPVYRYSLKDGIEDGYLTPFKVQAIASNIDDYYYHPDDGEIIAGTPQQNKLYTAKSDFNRNISIPQREQKRIEYWMDRIGPNEKTLVFCRSQKHAAEVRDYINQYASKKLKRYCGDDYCQRVTWADGEMGEQALRQFQDNERTRPLILTTSRKLSTGIDARNIRNIVLMRPCNDMVEFKQIIGRGTRLYEGKEFFTIFDFDRAHERFNEPEWDGEPIVVEEADLERPLDHAASETISSEPGDENHLETEQSDNARPQPIVIHLSDERTRQIQCVAATLYWGKQQRPVSAQEFIQSLYDTLPRFFNNEEELRQQWSDPDTRNDLLAALAKSGITNDAFEEIKRVVGKPQSDIYDVLAYIAFNSPMLTRQQRALQARMHIQDLLRNPKKVEFIEFILEQYVEEGIETLRANKLSDLVEIKYNRSIQEATAAYGSGDEFRQDFLTCQQSLYREII